MTTKEILKELSTSEVLGMTLAFIVTVSFVTFLAVLAYHVTKHANLI